MDDRETYGDVVVHVLPHFCQNLGNLQHELDMQHTSPNMQSYKSDDDHPLFDELHFAAVRMADCCQ